MLLISHREGLPTLSLAASGMRHLRIANAQKNSCLVSWSQPKSNNPKPNTTMNTIKNNLHTLPLAAIITPLVLYIVQVTIQTLAA